MLKFTIAYFIYIALFSFCVYGYGFQKNFVIILVKILTGKLAAGDSMGLLITDVIYKLLAVGIIILFITPMSKDLPYLVNREYNQVSGEVEEVRKLNSMPTHRHTVTIDQVSIHLYFMDTLREGESYTINYLPNSKFGIETIRNH